MLRLKAQFQYYKIKLFLQIIHFNIQARPLLSRALDGEEFEGLVDPKLEKNYVESEMLEMIGIAAACVRHSSAKRPHMGQVTTYNFAMPNA